MSLHLFLDANLSQQVSEDGDMSNPDGDTYNGTDGESRDRELFVANTQTELAADLGIGVNTVSVASSVFQNGDVIIVDDEKLLVQSGGGTSTLTVQRGYESTSEAEHTSGTKVYSAYDYTNLVIQPIDVDATSNETFWIRLALNQGGLGSATPGGSLNLGEKAHDETKNFWRQVTVPESTPVQNKTDLRLRIVGIENPAS